MTEQVQIGNIKIGGGNPIRIQSMTDTATEDTEATYNQIVELINAGSELVRVTVNNIEAAKSVPKIKEKLTKNGYRTPLIGDFHYNGHVLLANYPDCASALDKYRINPGNVGTNESRDYNFQKVIEIAIKNNKPIRIGVNWGSLDQELFTRLMKGNGISKNPKTEKEIIYEAMVQSTLNAAAQAEKNGMPRNKIVISAKMSDVQDVIKVNQMLSAKSNYALHIGLTEAGMGDKGLVASSSALAILLQQGIGDTIRVSITPKPGASRIREVEICQHILQTLGVRQFRPSITSCPGCGRTSGGLHKDLTEQVNNHISQNLAQWKQDYPGIETLRIAVMGCVVNGPGESTHADIGISLPGKTEDPVAQVYIDKKLQSTLKGQSIAQDFIKILDEYITTKYKK